MEDQKDIPLFPVSSWQVGPIPSHGIIAFRPNFLTNPMQKIEEENQGRYYAMTPQQVKNLIDDLQKALQKLASLRFQSPPGSRL